MATQFSEVSERGRHPHEPQVDVAPSLAQEMLDQCDGSPQLATDTLADRVLTDSEFLNEHLPAMAKAWARDVISGFVRDTRAQITKVQNGGGYIASLKSHAREEGLKLMDMPIFGGKRLGDCTPDEVRDSAAQYAANAKTFAFQARWQSAVAEAAVKNGTSASDPIRQSLSEATLKSLWEACNAQ